MEYWNSGFLVKNGLSLFHYPGVFPSFHYSNKRELSARPAFFSIRKEEIAIAVGTKIDAANLLFLNPFSLHLTDIDPGEVHHPLSNSS